MAHFAEIDDDNIVLRVLVVHNDDEHRGQEFLADDLGLGGTWIQTSYNTFGGKHYDPATGLEDSKPQLRYNYAGYDFTYDRENDAFIPPPLYPSFVLNETTMRYEPPIPYPTGKKGGPTRYKWDEENGNWLDLWDTSDALSQHNPDSKYYLEDVVKYEDPDYPFEDYPQKW